MRLALYQPDIPHNTGAILRLAACLSLGVDIIEPCGFLWEDKRLRRAGMDYRELAVVTRHASWERFLADRPHKGRIVLLSTQAAQSHTAFSYESDDTLLMGRESAGVPQDVFAAADARIIIPMAAGARSLNVAMAAAIVAAEALRQMDGFPAA
ncbi:MAG: TrmH family RNA methyltransferase [Rhodospirillaceae bacterium]